MVAEGAAGPQCCFQSGVRSEETYGVRVLLPLASACASIRLSSAPDACSICAVPALVPPLLRSPAWIHLLCSYYRSIRTFSRPTKQRNRLGEEKEAGSWQILGDTHTRWGRWLHTLATIVDSLCLQQAEAS